MKHCSPAAPAAVFPPSCHLPIEVPRDTWAGLIEHTALALEGRCIFDSETLARDLRAIAEALRVELPPVVAAIGTANTCFVGDRNHVHIHIHMAPCAEVVV